MAGPELGNENCRTVNFDGELTTIEGGIGSNPNS